VRRNDLIGRYLRPAVVVGGIIPFVLLVSRLLRDDLGANPAEELEHATGFTALWFLVASLAMTPLRRASGVAAFTRLRKPLGLWAFGYAVLHLGCYLVFDQSLLLGEIWGDIRKRPYITVGFTAFLMLSALAVTSPRWSARRLGGARWQAVHRLVYPAAALAVLHFLWLVKRDATRPVLAGVVLLLLLLARLPWRAPRSTPATLPSGS
jgi:sulfoxide reductase heme-binding subunit YedZ